MADKKFRNCIATYLISGAILGGASMYALNECANLEDYNPAITQQNVVTEIVQQEKGSNCGVLLGGIGLSALVWAGGALRGRKLEDN